MNKLVAKRMFFTKGVGIHKNELQSFELALRAAGVEKCNLVTVSSIFPPKCRIISRTEGAELLQPGEITFVVMARQITNEPGRMISAAIGMAQPKDKEQYGYISEHHGYGHTQRNAADFAEDLAATMLASTLGIDMDVDQAWDERKNYYKADHRHTFVSRSIAQTARGHKEGHYTTVVALAVMLFD